MAEVFLAKSFGVEGFEKTLAIKRILPSIAEDEDFIQMFIDEAKIAGQLSHVNICQIFELGKIKDAHFIAMEFVWGKDLLQLHNRFRKLHKNMPCELSAFIVARACEGLDYAHNKLDTTGKSLNLIHRDVSPQNILISYDGEIKVIDFGIAKAASRSSKTRAGVLKGKFGYMSPEQVRGLSLDRRSDIFALGTLFHELLTGQRLFVGESDFSTLEKVRNVEVTPPSVLNKDVPPELERIVMKALSADVESRYQWASELQEDLMAYVKTAGPGLTAKKLGVWMRESFASEIDQERLQIESYKGLRLDDPSLQDFDAHSLGGFPLAAPSAPNKDDDIKTNIAKAGARPSSDIHDEATRILDDAVGQLGDELSGESTVMLPGGSSAPAQSYAAAAPVPFVAVATPAASHAPMFPAHTTASRSKSAGMGAQLALTVGVALLVAGLVVGGYSLVFARAPGPGATLAVAAKDMGEAKVLVDGAAWGELQGKKGELLQAAGLSAGEHEVVARREGHTDCVRKVKLQDHATEVVLCEFEKAFATLKVELVTEGATVFVDGIEISAEAVAQPQVMEPGDEYTVRVRKKGFVDQTFTEKPKAGDVIERRIELSKIGAGSAPSVPEAPAKAIEKEKKEPKERSSKHDAKSTDKGPVEIVEDSKALRRKKRKEKKAAAAATTVAKTAKGGPGYFTAKTAPYAKVYVDGKYSGKRTPVGAAGKIELSPGKHKIEFEVDEKRYPFLVEIRSGQTTFMNKTLGKQSIK